MEQYDGLDVSLTMTAICIVNWTGKIEREGVVASDRRRSRVCQAARPACRADRARNWSNINMAVDRAE